MTRVTKKNRESIVALETAKILGAQWKITELGEEPDLIVMENGIPFGLEITEIFTGKVSQKRGSKMKESETNVDRALDTLRCAYVAKGGVPLKIEFLGNINPENLSWA